MRTHKIQLVGIHESMSFDDEQDMTIAFLVYKLENIQQIHNREFAEIEIKNTERVRKYIKKSLVQINEEVRT